jgi:hypothetical protein
MVGDADAGEVVNFDAMDDACGPLEHENRQRERKREGERGRGEDGRETEIVCRQMSPLCTDHHFPVISVQRAMIARRTKSMHGGSELGPRPIKFR